MHGWAGHPQLWQQRGAAGPCLQIQRGQGRMRAGRGAAGGPAPRRPEEGAAVGSCGVRWNKSGGTLRRSSSRWVYYRAAKAGPAVLMCTV